MRILIDNGGYALRNHGDTAMLQVAVRRMAEAWPTAEVRVLTDAPKWLSVMCPDATPVSARALRSFARNGARFRAVSRLLRPGSYADGRNALKAVDDCDLVIACGGGYLADDFQAHATRTLRLLLRAQSHGRPTALFSQGIGPIDDPGLSRLAAKCLSGADLVAVREPAADCHLRRWGVSEERVIVTGDDAIEPAYLHAPAQPGNALGVNFRMAGYSGVTSDALSRIGANLRNFADHMGSELVEIPISFNRSSDSLTLRECIPGVFGEEPPLGPPGTPDAVMRQAGRCRLVVTGSYHAAVFALAQGVPAVGLAGSPYYAQKFVGLQEMFGDGAYVFRLEDEIRLESLSAMVGAAWASAAQVHDSLIAAARRQIARSRLAYERLHDVITKKKTEK